MAVSDECVWVGPSYLAPFTEVGKLAFQPDVSFCKNRLHMRDLGVPMSAFCMNFRCASFRSKNACRDPPTLLSGYRHYLWYWLSHFQATFFLTWKWLKLLSRYFGPSWKLQIFQHVDPNSRKWPLRIISPRNLHEFENTWTWLESVLNVAIIVFRGYFAGIRQYLKVAIMV